MNIAVLAAFVVLGASGLWLWRAELLHRRAVVQLDAALSPQPGSDVEAAIEAAIAAVDTYPRRYRWLPPLAGIVVAAALMFVLRLAMPVAIAFGLLGGVLVSLAEEALAAFRAARIETQLSEAIDMLVSSLRVGASVVAGFEAVLRDARLPLRTYLQDVVGRIRLGEEPGIVIMTLAEHVPLETFRLFAMALAIHWEVGGSLAPTLATVGRTIRDRIELDRRVQTQGVEANASAFAVLAITYVLAYLMWQSSPERIVAFMTSDIGTMLVAIVVGLQGVGLLWMSRISRSGF